MRHFNETLQKFGCAPVQVREVPYGDRGSLDAYFKAVERQFGLNPEELDTSTEAGND